MIFHYKPGFLSHRGTLKSSIFCLGFSMKSTLQLLAYVHGLGNLQILSIHNIHLVAALDFTERSTCWALHPGPRPVRSGCWSGMDPEIAENHPLNTPQQLPRWSSCDQKNFIGTIVSSYELNTIHYFGIIPDYTPICICNASGPLVPGLPSLSGANAGQPVLGPNGCPKMEVLQTRNWCKISGSRWTIHAFYICIKHPWTDLFNPDIKGVMAWRGLPRNNQSARMYQHMCDTHQDTQSDAIYSLVSASIPVCAAWQHGSGHFFGIWDDHNLGHNLWQTPWDMHIYYLTPTPLL